jgi:hypothetical protein
MITERALSGGPLVDRPDVEAAYRDDWLKRLARTDLEHAEASSGAPFATWSQTRLDPLPQDIPVFGRSRRSPANGWRPCRA